MAADYTNSRQILIYQVSCDLNCVLNIVGLLMGGVLYIFILMGWFDFDGVDLTIILYFGHQSEM